MPVESTSVTSKQKTAVSEASVSASSSSVVVVVESIPEVASTENAAVVVYPTVWTFDRWESWKKKLPWLICRNAKVGCAVCCDAGTTQTVKTGVHISAEWTAVSVEAKTARKLKEKIYRHRNSTAHIAAENILKVRQQDLLKGVIIDADSHYFEETSRVFRTAYAIAKMDLSFTAHRGLLDLQEANGLDVGKVHKSDHSCSKIISHISSQMKKAFCERLKSLSPHVAVMLDESTLYKKSVIAVYLRTRLVDISESAEYMLETNYGVTNVYFGLVEASEGCTAKGIMGAVECEFDQFKLNELLLQNKLLIAICTDGASVMTGTSSGVATQFIARYGENVEAFHCLAHRLELSVNDALKSVTATNHFQSFLKSLYALYSQSPKNQRELGEVAADTETQLLHITAIFDVRWVASSFRSVRAVWRNFPALHDHFRNASLDLTRTSTERAKFAGLLKKLTTVSFLTDLATMKDVLRELSSLSLKLQSRTCNIVTGFSEIDSTITVLKAMKTAGGGKSTMKVLAISATNTFKGVPLAVGKPGINAGQFMAAVIDELSRRVNGKSTLLADLQKLYKNNWPPVDSDELILFGEESVTRLAKRLGLAARPVVEAYRKYKTQKGKPQSKLLRLLAAAETYPGSTAECERGFSAMNETVWDKRSAMNVNTVSSTMFIKLNGVPVTNFDPYPYVRSWIAAGNRQSTSWVTGPKAAKKPDIHQTLVEKCCM